MDIKRKMDYKGLVVTCKADIGNGWARLPARTRFIVRSTHNGFTTQSLPCKCCGLKVTISKVGSSSFYVDQHPYNYERLAWNKKCKYTNGLYGRKLVTPNEPMPTFENFKH